MNFLCTAYVRKSSQKLWTHYRQQTLSIDGIHTFLLFANKKNIGDCTCVLPLKQGRPLDPTTQFLMEIAPLLKDLTR